MRIVFAGVFMAVSTVQSFSGEWAPDSAAFSPKLVFSETPETGRRWRGGVRMSDMICWEFYYTMADWCTLDLLYAGFSDLPIREPGDTGTLRDRFSLFTIKSRPLTHTFGATPYKAAFGLKLFGSDFELRDQSGTVTASSQLGSGGLFATQSIVLSGRHYVNLFSMASFRDIDRNDPDRGSIVTWYLVPGYRWHLGRERRWSFGLEYYMMNPVELPLKFVQYAFDESNNEMYNPNQYVVSWMFYGMSYTRRHFRLDLNLSSHISFQGPIIPILGAGWNF